MVLVGKNPTVPVAPKFFHFSIFLLAVFGLLFCGGGGVMVHSFWCHRKGPGVPWTLELPSIHTLAYRCGSVGLWDCSPRGT